MDNWKRMLKLVTPDALVMACFITPGAILASALSGATYGYSILWALVLTTATNIILQEMQLRLGLVTGQKLPQLIRSSIRNQFVANLVLILFVIVVFLSAMLYVTGNISAIQLGITHFFPNIGMPFFFICCGVVLILLVSYPIPNVIEKCIIAVLILLHLLIILSASVAQPNFISLVKGIFLPFSSLDSTGWLCVMGLMGTTVLPYQLFLYMTSARNRYTDVSQLTKARVNISVASALSSLFMALIILCASAVFGKYSDLEYELSSIAQIFNTVSSQPTGFLAIVFCFTGLCSAILTALAIAEFFGSFFSSHSLRKRLVCTSCSYLLIVGAISIAYLASRSAGFNILFTQVINVALLPFIMLLLLYLMNHRMLGVHRNTFVENLLLLCLLAMTSIMTYQAWVLFSSIQQTIMVQIINLLPF